MRTIYLLNAAEISVLSLGTGHGVGAALNVHEGPHRISPNLDAQPLVPGMIVSNEPGYYEPGNFGIRIENLLVVVEKPELGEIMRSISNKYL